MLSYTTKQGDCWDMISLSFYGDERYMHLLIEANPRYRDIVIFPANIDLTIPDKEDKAAEYTPTWR